LRSIVVGQRGLQLCERHLDVDNLDLLGLRLAQLLLLVGEVGLLAPVGVLLLVVLLLLLRLRVVGAGETRGEQERGRRQEQRERQACFGLREVGGGEKRRRGVSRLSESSGTRERLAGRRKGSGQFVYVISSAGGPPESQRKVEVG